MKVLSFHIGVLFHMKFVFVKFILCRIISCETLILILVYRVHIGANDPI